MCRRRLRAHLLRRCAAGGVRFRAGELVRLEPNEAGDTAALALADGSVVRTRCPPGASLISRVQQAGWSSREPFLRVCVSSNGATASNLERRSELACSRWRYAFFCKKAMSPVWVLMRDLCCRLATLASGAAAGKFLRYEAVAPSVAAQTAYGIECEVQP